MEEIPEGEPERRPRFSKKKREEIREFLAQNQTEIETGQLVVFFVDECHLLWGDVCGYVWGKTDIRIEIPIKNEKDRQTYFGALDDQTKKFIVHEYSAGNGENTVAFIQDLQSQCPGQRIALIWDGASYHQSDEVKDFLASVNHEYEPSQRQITCILLAPNAPERSSSRRCLVTGKELFEKVLVSM